MAIFGKKKTTTPRQEPYENRGDIEKLSVVIAIVGKGQGYTVCKKMESVGSSVQVVQRGRGSAHKAVYDILGVEDGAKDIVFSIIKSKDVPNAMLELKAFIDNEAKNKGIGFSVPMDSVIGVKVYQFLAGM